MINNVHFFIKALNNITHQFYLHLINHRQESCTGFFLSGSWKGPLNCWHSCRNYCVEETEAFMVRCFFLSPTITIIKFEHRAGGLQVQCPLHLPL